MSGRRKFTPGYIPTERQRAWRASPRFREIARQTILAWNAKQSTLPKCGAKRKSDGGPCQNLALANGRCKFHGGRVPKGSGKWHVAQWPKNGPDAARKTARKLRDAKRKAGEREKRLAAMMPEERAAYEAWRRTHDPLITQAERNRRAETRRRDREAGALFQAARPARPEIDDLDREIQELKTKAAAIMADPRTWRTGVFE